MEQDIRKQGDRASVESAAGPTKDKPYKVVLSRQVELMLQSLPEQERAQMLDLFEKLSTGEIQGEPMTQEEIDELRAQGVNFDAMAQSELDREGKA